MTNIRRWIPQIRSAAFALTGLSAGVFVATGMGAISFGYVPPYEFKFIGTIIVVTGLAAAALALALDRRRKRRDASSR